MRGDRVTTSQEKEGRVKIRGLGRAKRPNPEKREFLGLECRCEARTEEGRAGIRVELAKDPSVGGIPQVGLERALKMNSPHHSCLTFLFPKRALTAARAPLPLQAGPIEPPAVLQPHHPLAAFDAFGSRDTRKGHATKAGPGLWNWR